MADRPGRRTVLRLALTGLAGLAGTACAAGTAACASPSRRSATDQPSPRPPGGAITPTASTTTRDDGTSVTTWRYGPGTAQVADLLLPASLAGDPAAGPTRGGVVALVHGGYWRPGYDRSLEDAVARDLLARDVPVWNVDYRAAGAGGGWPGTLEDVAAACDALVEVAAGEGPGRGLDPDRVVVVGHSAGGQLALWAAGRHRLPTDAPGAAPRLRPRAAVAQAGVDDLVAAAEQGLGGGATTAFLGGSPQEVPRRYALCSPVALLPLGVPVLAVTGTDDVTVPPDQTRRFVAAARAAGDDVEQELVDGEEHFAHLDPASRCWRLAREFALAQLA